MMNQNEFEKYYKGTSVRVTWDNSISGVIVTLLPDDYIGIETDDGKLKSFPLNQLEWID